MATASAECHRHPENLFLARGSVPPSPAADSRPVHTRGGAEHDRADRAIHGPRVHCGVRRRDSQQDIQHVPHHGCRPWTRRIGVIGSIALSLIFGTENLNVPAKISCPKNQFFIIGVAGKKYGSCCWPTRKCIFWFLAPTGLPNINPPIFPATPPEKLRPYTLSTGQYLLAAPLG